MASNRKHNQAHKWPGVPLAFASAALFGATLPLSKFLLEGIGPFLLAGLLYLGAGLGLSLVVLWRRLSGNKAEAALTRSDIPWLFVAIVTGGILGPLLLMFGLSQTTAANGSLLLNLEGLATMVIAWLAYRENVDRRLLLGAFAILAGALMLAWQADGLSLDVGALLVAGACLAWGLDNNVTRKISAADPVVISCMKGLIAGMTNVTIAFYAGTVLPAPGILSAAAVVGFFGIGVSLVLFILALRHLGTARTGAYYSMAPFIGAILSVLFLGEAFTFKLAAAAALMGIGLWLHLTEQHEHEHEHDALEHDHAHSHDSHHKHEHSSDVAEPHSHRHVHQPMRHKHPHYPDLHHRHRH